MDPDPGIEPTSIMFPALAGRFITTEPTGKPYYVLNTCQVAKMTTGANMLIKKWTGKKNVHVNYRLVSNFYCLWYGFLVHDFITFIIRKKCSKYGLKSCSLTMTQIMLIYIQKYFSRKFLEIKVQILGQNSFWHFFMVPLSHLYMITGKTIALTTQTFVWDILQK